MSEQVRARDGQWRALETDERFVSGRWRGFWVQDPARSRTDMNLEFSGGHISGEGYDWVGAFVIRGTYELESGKVSWTKSYLGAHCVKYDGYAEVKNGIWGLWNITGLDKGGFQIWPDAEKTRARERRVEAERPQRVEIDWQGVSERTPLTTTEPV